MTGDESTGARMNLYPFPLGRQRLLDGRWKEAQAGVRRYLLRDDLPARLMRQWHLNAGIDTFVAPLGGPERPDLAHYRGDFVGHYMSVTAKMAAATGDDAVKAQGERVVAEVARCQEALKADGFVAGFPPTRMDQVERGCFALVPYYAMHKVMAGLLDQYTLCGNAQAMDVLGRLAGHIKRRIERLDPEHWRKIVLPIEYGGMLEFGCNLYAATRDPGHLALAMHFDERAFYDPVEAGQDVLTGRHANTNIPKAVGAARAYQITGEARWLAIARNFWQMFTERRMYVCGGSDHAEMWFDPALMPRSLSQANHEFCCVYNMLKLSRYLLEITGEAKYADYVERATVNTVLGTLRPADGMIGSSLLGMSTGCTRTWSTPYDSFWCCVGTGIESGAALGEGVFYHDGGHGALTVARYAAARLDWTERGLNVGLDAAYPDDGRVKLTVRMAQPQEFVLRLWKPAWAERIETSLNGQPVSGALDGRFLTLRRAWKDGDTVEVNMPMRLYTEPLLGDSDVRAIRFGPAVLAGLVRDDELARPERADDSLPAPTPGPPVQDWFLTGDPAATDTWLRPAAGAPLTFATVGINRSLTFIPMNRVNEQAYGVYWPMPAPGSARLAALEAAHESARRHERRRVVDRVRIGDAASESAHGLESDGSAVGHHAGWPCRGGGASFAYVMRVIPDEPMALLVTSFEGEGGWRGFEARVDGHKVESVGISRMPPCEFAEKETPIPANLTQGKTQVRVSFYPVDAEGRTGIASIYGLAVVRADDTSCG